MNKQMKWLFATIALAVAALLVYRWKYPDVVPVVTLPVLAANSQPAAAPAIAHPIVPAVADSTPLPELDDSDASIKASLEQIFDASAVAKYLIPTQIIRHIVATVDNLPRNRLAVPLRPIKATSERLLVAGTEGDWVIASENYGRYTPFVQLVDMTNVEQLAGWYRRYYLLFQQAYQNLGYPDGYFNDRLVQAIDDLLATPELMEPLHLIRPKVFYEFTDPALESRSAGQKTLLRMGAANSRTIKAKLRELRIAITRPGA